MDEIISYTMCAVKVRNAKLRNYLNLPGADTLMQRARKLLRPVKFLPFVRSKLFMTGHVTDRFRLVNYPVSKKCLFNTFFINETNKKAI